MSFGRKAEGNADVNTNEQERERKESSPGASSYRRNERSIRTIAREIPGGLPDARPLFTRNKQITTTSRGSCRGLAPVRLCRRSLLVDERVKQSVFAIRFGDA